MGDVYQAADSKLGRSVAIKILPEVFSHDADRVAQFEREARVLASINHAHIAAIHGLEEFGERKKHAFSRRLLSVHPTVSSERHAQQRVQMRAARRIAAKYRRSYLQHSPCETEATRSRVRTVHSASRQA